MNSPESLMEFHRRCHSTFAKLLEHCDTLTAGELHRTVEGFGYPTVQLQIHHVIGAERYWFGLLQGRMDVDDDEENYPGVVELERFRAEVEDSSRRYLQETSAEQLTLPRKMTTWGGKKATLVPAHIIARTQVHIYHHQGQVLAMCRLMGKPANGFDYPIVP